MNSQTIQIRYPIRHLIPANIEFARLSLDKQLRALKQANITTDGPRPAPKGGLFQPRSLKDSLEVEIGRP